MSVYNEDYLIALEYTMPHKSSYLFFYSLQKKTCAIIMERHVESINSALS